MNNPWEAFLRREFQDATADAVSFSDKCLSVTTLFYQFSERELPYKLFSFCYYFSVCCICNYLKKEAYRLKVFLPVFW